MKRNLVFFIMSAMAFITVNSANLKANDNSPADTAIIAFTETSHDYGTIQKGSDGTYVFTFKNTGNIPLVLSNVRSSCGCTIPTWPKEPIAPGKTGEIKVIYNTNISGGFQKSITINSNSGTVVLTIKGSVQN
jgi:hypothetical protein